MIGFGNRITFPTLSALLLFAGCASAPADLEGKNASFDWAVPAESTSTSPVVARQPAPASVTVEQPLDPLETTTASGLLDPTAPYAPLQADSIWGEEDAEPGAWAMSGLYIGGSLNLSDVNGDFDGNLVLVGPADLILIPELEASVGYGVQLSFRWTSFEIIANYEQTAYDEANTTDETTLNFLDVNLRQYYNVENAWQPFLMIGLGWATGEIENGAADLGLTTFADAELDSGISINVGGGLAWYPIRWLSIWGQAQYRFVEFQEARGLSGEMLVDGGLDADTWEVTAGASIRLLPPRGD